VSPRTLTALFDRPLHVGAPNVGSAPRFLELAQGIFERGWLTNNGPLVLELERRLADYLGVRHCLAICNGTVALELASRGLGLTGEVIVPSMTFIASAHALQWQGITPVFCDIDRTGYCIDPAAIERHVTSRTTGILGVHLYGRPCATAAIQQVADRHGLKVFYDSAHAFGVSSGGGKMIGGFGDCEVFSFHATKFFHTFEGGAITTNDSALAEKLAYMRNFGFAGEDDVRYIGVNGKMPEISAAMGLANLECIDDFVRANRENLAAYGRGLADVPGLTLIEYDERERNNFQYVILEVDPAGFGMDRDALYRRLRARQILARRYFYPGCHRMEPYRTLYPDAGRMLPNTEELTARVLALPTGSQVTVPMVEAICGLVRELQRAGDDEGDR